MCLLHLFLRTLTLPSHLAYITALVRSATGLFGLSILCGKVIQTAILDLHGLCMKFPKKNVASWVVLYGRYSQMLIYK